MAVRAFEEVKTAHDEARRAILVPLQRFVYGCRTLEQVIEVWEPAKCFIDKWGASGPVSEDELATLRASQVVAA